MAEWLKAVDCKSIEFFNVGSNPTFSFLKPRYSIIIGSASALGVEGCVFKSHYLEVF